MDDITTTNMHELFMSRAIELAKQGRGYVSPNPMVGCVLVLDGDIIGEGFHEKFMCKKWKWKMPTLKKKSENSEDTSSSEHTEENKKKGIGGIWNKIKSFGGKKVGEPG